MKSSCHKTIKQFDKSINIDSLYKAIKNYNLEKHKYSKNKLSYASNKVCNENNEQQQLIINYRKFSTKDNNGTVRQKNKKIRGRNMNQLLNECRRIQKLLNKYEKQLNIVTDVCITELLKPSDINISQIQQNVEQRVQVVKEKIEYKHHQYMLDYLNSQDRYGNSGLILCCQTNEDNSDSRAKCVRILIDNGINPNMRNQYTGWTAIFWLCYWGDLQSIKILLQQEINVLVMDRDGYYPIDIAGMNQNLQVVQTMVEYISNIFMNTGSNVYMEEIKQEKKQDDGRIDPYNVPVHVLVKSTYLRQTLFHWIIQYAADVQLLNRLVDHNFYLFMPYFKQKKKTVLISSAKYDYKQIYDLKIDDKMLHTLIKQQVEQYGKYLAGDRNGFMFDIRNNGLEENVRLKYHEIDWGNKAKKMIQKCDKWVIKFSKYCMNVMNQQYSKEVAIKMIKQKYCNQQDNYGNTPLHYANSIEDIKFINYFIKQWECNINVENREGFEARNFSSTQSVLQYYKKIMVNTRQLSKQDLDQENIRIDFVIQFNKQIPELQKYLSQFIRLTTKGDEKQTTDKDQIERINLYLDILIKYFDVYLMESADQKYIYAMISIEDSEMLEQAEKCGVKLKLLNGEDYKVFNRKNQKEFAPIRSKERQEIILALINKHMDLDLLISQYLVSSYYPVHDQEGIKTVKGLGLMNYGVFRSNVMDFTWGGAEAEFKTVKRINQYFGSAYSFLYAWQSFNAYQLLIRIFVPGIVVFVMIEIQTNCDDCSYDLCEIIMIGWTLYVIIMMIWIVYGWESKVYEINARLGTLGYFYQKKDIQSVCRKDWRRDDIIEVDTLEYTQKEFDPNIQFTRLKKTVCYVLMGLMITFAVSLSLYINLKVIQDHQNVYDDNLTEQTKLHRQKKSVSSEIIRNKNEAYRYIIIYKVIDQVVIQFFNQIYKIFSNVAIDLENHKYDVQQQYQRSTYMFYAVLTTSTLPIVVRYVVIYQNPQMEIQQKNEIFSQTLLTQLLAQAASQFAMNIVFNVLYYKFMKMNYFKSIRKQASFQQKTDEQDQSSYQRVVINFSNKDNIYNYEFVSNIDVDSIELDSLKNPVTDDELALMYTNSMVKLSYCIVFACYFHLGIPILIVIYILELQFINIYLAKYRRRSISQIQVDIQNWSQIQRILVQVSIISNFFFIVNFDIIAKYQD